MASKNSKSKKKAGAAKAKAPGSSLRIVKDDLQYDPEPFETLPGAAPGMMLESAKGAGLGEGIQLEGGVVDADGNEVQLSPVAENPQSVAQTNGPETPMPMTPEEAAILILEKAGYEIVAPVESGTVTNPRIVRLGNRRETTYWVNRVSWFAGRIPSYYRREDGLIAGSALDAMDHDVERLIKVKCIAIHVSGSEYPTDPEWHPAIPAVEESNTLATVGSSA